MNLMNIIKTNYCRFYSNRYMGKQKKTGEKGFVKPAAENFRKMEQSVIQHGNDVFTVQSTSQPHQAYLFDMSIGTCECVVGKIGTPWFQRKIFAEIRIGTSLPLEFYEGLYITTQL